MKKKHFVHLALALYRLFGTTLFSAHQRVALLNAICAWACGCAPFDERSFRAVVSSGRPNWNQSELKEMERETHTQHGNA